MSRECTMTSNREGINPTDTTSSISNVMTCPLNSTNSEIAICSEVLGNTPTLKLVALMTDDANNALSAYSKFYVLYLNTGKEKSKPYNLL